MYPASPAVNPSIAVIVVEPVAASYKGTADQAAPVQKDTVMSKFENRVLSIAEVNSIFTAQTLFASVTTLNAYVLVSPESNAGSDSVPGKYLT